MESQIIDPCVLGEVFSSYSEEELKRWGVEGCETTEVQIRRTARVFKLRLDVLKNTNHVSFFFCDPDGRVASRLWMDRCLWKEDILTIVYTVTAHSGGGPDSCQVRLPSGKCLRVNLYSSAT